MYLPGGAVWLAVGLADGHDTEAPLASERHNSHTAASPWCLSLSLAASTRLFPPLPPLPQKFMATFNCQVYVTASELNLHKTRNSPFCVLRSTFYVLRSPFAVLASRFSVRRRLRSAGDLL